MVIGKSDLKNIMEKHDLKPSKSLGQNFVRLHAVAPRTAQIALEDTCGSVRLELPDVLSAPETMSKCDPNRP